MAALATMPAHAQTASPRQTPPSGEALTSSPEARFSFPPAQGLVAPAGAEAIRFTLNDIAIEGAFPELESATRTLVSPLLGREASVAEIYGFAADLQQAYFAAGFPLARVVVPPQELDADGRVRMVVIDGFVDSIDASQLPEKLRARVQRVLEPLVGSPRPTRTLIERRLLLAGDTAGLSLRSTLTPGAHAGATVLVLTGEYDAFSAALAVDNRVSDQLGRLQTTASAVLNSPFGQGERVYAIVAAYPEADGLSDKAQRRYLSVGMDWPIGDNGLSLGLSADYSSTRPKGDIAEQMLESEYARVGVALSFPFVRSRAANLIGRAGLDAISDTQRTRLAGPPATTLSADRTRVLRLGLDGDAELFGDARLRYGVSYSKGLDLFDARTEEETNPLKPLSREGADAVFSALDAEFSLAAPALFGTTAVLSARGRYTFNKPLLRSEQFSPSGSDGLSGPPPGLLIGDSGSVSRIELQRPLVDRQSAAIVAPYAFVSAASVRLENPSALERRQTDAIGAGVGLRIHAFRRDNGSYGLTAAIEISRVESDQRDLDRDWTGASIAWRF